MNKTINFKQIKEDLILSLYENNFVSLEIFKDINFKFKLMEIMYNDKRYLGQ